MLYITTIFAFALPIGAMIFWKKKTDLTMGPFFAGAICFLLFALGIEQALHSAILGTDTVVSRTIQENPVLYVIYGCLTAGIFEESGRLFGYKLILRNQTEKEVSVAYGIGHGGIEAIMTLGLTYAMLCLVSFGVSMGNEQADAIMAETLVNAQNVSMVLAMLERVTAMMLHIGLSILVFIAANRSGRMIFYPLAILLHALADVPVAMYQVGMLQSVPLVESMAFGCAAVVLGFGIYLYRRMDR